MKREIKQGKFITKIMRRLPLFLFVTILSFNVAAQQRDKIHTDGHIGIKLDLVEKTSNYPSELKIPGQRSPILKDGHNYVIVNFTIDTINNIHVVSFGGRDDEKSVIFDDRGETHNLQTWNSSGWKYKDPEKGLASPAEIAQGSKGIMVFEIPENESFKELDFVYYFKESWDDKQNQKGKINIPVLTTIIE
jgi:hypothetical protein